MGKGFKRGRLSPLGSAMAAQQQGRFAQAPRGGSKVAAPRVPVAQLAELAGERGAVTPPMDSGARAMAYAAQRGGTAPILTDRQRRRLRKAGRKSGQVPASVARAELTGADLDRYYAAQLAVYAR
jgi:hypothetical protein